MNIPKISWVSGLKVINNLLPAYHELTTENTTNLIFTFYQFLFILESWSEINPCEWTALLNFWENLLGVSWKIPGSESETCLLLCPGN